MNGKCRGQAFDSPPWGCCPTLRSCVLPSLAQGGVAAPSRKCSPSSAARTGWFVQLPINRLLEQTAPSARANVAAHHFLIAQPPRLDQGGEYPVFNVRQQPQPRRGTKRLSS